MSIEIEKELYKQMDLLQIKEVSTYRQQKNGTRIFELPIKKYGQKIRVGSFKSGYVRRMNGGYTPYQLNKCVPDTEYYPERKWCDIQKTGLRTGKYLKYIGKKRILIPNETDRIKHLITYCLKNYYINGANQVEDGKCIPKWRHEYELEKRNFIWSGGQVTDQKTGDVYIHNQHAYWNKWQDTPPSSVEITIDGHRYKVK